MCGIGFILDAEGHVIQFSSTAFVLQQGTSTDSEPQTLELEDLEKGLHKRGPDSLQTIKVFGNRISLCAAVLYVRGKTAQPLIHPQSKNILLWNGEIFGGKLEVKHGHNDTQVLLDELSKSEEEAHIFNTLKSIEGPFAFLYWQEQKARLWFGRNVIGQRSLLLHVPSSQCPILSVSSLAFSRFPLSTLQSSSKEAKGEEEDDEEVELQSDWKEVTPSLFSLTFSLKDDKHIEAVTKEYPWNEERSAVDYFGKRKHVSPSPSLTSVESKVDYVDGLLSALEQSMKVRLSDIPIAKDNREESSRVAILFSGGIDSMIVAALAHKFVPIDQSIDLLNVAFGTNSFDVPDRKTALNGLLELQNICHGRKWNFVKIDVTPDQVNKYEQHIYLLAFPKCTVMDVSISTALWFAARGEGTLLGSEDSGPYVCQAKLVFDGLGADELFAGYGRHRTAFRRGGWETLQSELELDLNRIWTRNLGRDDRVISDHGRETRFPFLDEHVISFVHTIPLWEICNLELPLGVGDKMLLRQLGKKLGLTESTKLSKRAIQFGTRVSRALFPSLPQRKLNGTQIFTVQHK